MVKNWKRRRTLKKAMPNGKRELANGIGLGEQMKRDARGTHTGTEEGNKRGSRSGSGKKDAGHQQAFEAAWEHFHAGYFSGCSSRVEHTLVGSLLPYQTHTHIHTDTHTGERSLTPRHTFRTLTRSTTCSRSPALFLSLCVHFCWFMKFPSILNTSALNSRSYALSCTAHALREH